MARRQLQLSADGPPIGLQRENFRALPASQRQLLLANEWARPVDAGIFDPLREETERGLHEAVVYKVSSNEGWIETLQKEDVALDHRLVHGLDDELGRRWIRPGLEVDAPVAPFAMTDGTARFVLLAVIGDCLDDGVRRRRQIALAVAGNEMCDFRLVPRGVD